MADYTSFPGTGGYSFESDGAMGPEAAPKVMTKLANSAGALMSIALVIGIGVWGYKLVMRDVSGIPDCACG